MSAEGGSIPLKRYGGYERRRVFWLADARPHPVSSPEGEGLNVTLAPLTPPALYAPYVRFVLKRHLYLRQL